MMRGALTCIALSAMPTDAMKVSTSVTLHANPVRKVVMMLQMMQKKIEEEKKTETELYNKFRCYCKDNHESLADNIAAAETKIPKLSSDIKASEEEKAQTEEDLKTAQDDRVEAKKAMAEATSVREKEAKAFAASKAEYESNIEDITGAVKALEKGMSGTFLQTRAAAQLRKLVKVKEDMLEEDREDVMAFLQSTEGSDYAPQSGQITGILKQMGDEMAKGLADATSTENSAIADYENLMAAKKKEVDALTASIETKMTRIGELAVSIQQMKNDLENTSEQLAEDKAFLANLEKSCDNKNTEWEAREKERAEEQVAIADTIKVLNDDDALDLFKKTLPSASSFMQLSTSASAMRAKAFAAIKAGRTDGNRKSHSQFDMILLALHGKKIGFSKIIGMIDDMVSSLKKEQDDDNNKRDYCTQELDTADDKKKSLEKSISDGEAAIASTKDSIENVKDEIEALAAGIKKLDQAVAEATEQRKEENKEFKALMSSDSAAKELLNFAKNRLNKFYNPKLYKAAPKVEVSAEDRIFENEGGDLSTPAPGGIAGTGITALAQQPGPAPKTEFGGKQSQSSSGVISMLNLLIADLDKEMTEAQTEEKDAQADYETLMKDSAEKRATDAKAMTEKKKSQADLEGDLEDHKSDLKSNQKQLKATKKYIAETHADCDWLIKYFEVRKTARAGEIDALGNAKAVLSGADYSLLQETTSHHLRRVAKRN